MFGYISKFSIKSMTKSHFFRSKPSYKPHKSVANYSAFAVKFPSLSIVRIPCFEKSFEITTGAVHEWTKNIGDNCKENEVVCKFETLKAVIDIHAGTNGKLITKCVELKKELSFDNNDITTQPALFVLEKN